MQRFLQRVIISNNSFDNCWSWRGCSDGFGYGFIDIETVTYKAHRLSYELFIGDPTNLVIFHSCDNPRCTNPLHLKGGTHLDNMRDMVMKGRSRGACGEKNACSKLKNEEVTRMRYLYSTGKYKQCELGKMFGTNWRNVSLIVNGKSWKHLL